MIPWSSSIDIIDKYFSESTTQAVIAEIEEVRIKAYNAKRGYYKKYRPIVLLLYIVIGIWLYFYLQAFGSSKIFWDIWFFLIVTPWGLFIAMWNSKQSSLLESKKVTTKLFDHFIKFILPDSQFSENNNLYNWDPLDSELFINTKQEKWFFASSVSINKNICNSFSFPLLSTTEKITTVNLEWVEVTIDKTTWSGKSKKTVTDMGMLYKIDFKNPKRTIRQWVKVIPNSDSRFKEKDNLISLENQEFEKYFDVYSTDPLEARMILTSNVMDKLTEISRITQGKYSFHFINNIFYVKNALYNDLNNKDINNITDIIEVVKWADNDSSVINVNRDNSIEKNSSIYRKFYNEILHIQQLVDALNVDYFNKL